MIPSIIPKRRVIILSITLIFTSALITSSSSLLFSLNNVTTEIYPKGDDIIIINSNTANTPFTSSVPSVIEDVLRQNNGVLNISSETILPIIMNGMTAYLRGINWIDFKSVNDVKLLRGENFENFDKTRVIIGKNFVKGDKKIKIGDVIRIGSTINNKNINVIVSGIFESSNPRQNDEIFASHKLSKELNFDYIDYSHIITRIDLSITNKEEIYDYISRKNNIKIIPVVANFSQKEYKWNLKIFDYNKKQILNQDMFGNVDIDLPNGQYYFEASIVDKASKKQAYFIKENSTILLQIGQIEYNITIASLVNNNINPNMFYEIFNSEDEKINTGITNSNGLSHVLLLTANYTLKLWYNNFYNFYNFTIIRRERIEFNYIKTQVDERIEFNGFSNNSILLENFGYITTKVDLNRSIIYIDNKMILPYFNKIPYELADGIHNLTIYRNIDKYFYIFNINSTLKYFEVESINIDDELNSFDFIRLSSTGVSKSHKLSIKLNNKTTFYQFQNNDILINISSTINKNQLDIFSTSISSLEVIRKFIFFKDNLTYYEIPRVSNVVQYENNTEYSGILYNIKINNKLDSSLLSEITNYDFISNLNNNHSFLYVYFSNKNLNQTYLKKVKFNEVIFNITLPSKYIFWNITVLYQGVIFSFFMSSNQTEIIIGIEPTIIEIYDSNRGTTFNFTGLIQITNRDNDESIQIILDFNSEIPIYYQNYTLIVYNYKSEELFYGDQYYSNIIIHTNLVNQTGKLYIQNQGGNIVLVNVKHILSNSEQILTKFIEYWLIINFPIGNIEINIKIGNYNNTFLIWFQPSFNNDIKLFFDFKEGDQIDYWGYSTDIIQIQQLDVNGDQVIKGPLKYIELIIYAEIIIILITLTVNISGVYIGLIAESKKELYIARNIGFTKNQIITSIIQEIKLIGLFASIAGIFSGIIVNKILINNTSILLFGYGYYPTYGYKLWIFVIITTYFLSYLSARLGIKLEKIDR